MYSADYFYSDDALKIFIKKFIYGMPIFFIELHNKLVLRSRCELNLAAAESIVKESAISYRRDTKGIQTGRCNLNGEAIFYGTVIEKIEDSTAKTETACAAEVSDLLPFTRPVESGASGVLKLDRSGGRHYLIGR